MSCICELSKQMLFLSSFSMVRFINKIELVELLVDEVNCIQFLCNEGLLNTQKLCSECDSPITLKKIADRKLP